MEWTQKGTRRVGEEKQAVTRKSARGKMDFGRGITEKNMPS